MAKMSSSFICFDVTLKLSTFSCREDEMSAKLYMTFGYTMQILLHKIGHL